MDYYFLRTLYGLGDGPGRMEDHSNSGDANRQVGSCPWVRRRNRGRRGVDGDGPFWITSQHDSHDYLVSHGRGGRESVVGSSMGGHQTNCLCVDLYAVRFGALNRCLLPPAVRIPLVVRCSVILCDFQESVAASHQEAVVVNAYPLFFSPLFALLL